ncbi:hypothetical protein E1200_18825 [Actinomadura sp. GC306]|uniref:hypothetical protein n=1 Tax=Actinomadura sp. GC306 TaxID=2530367 RepID=UPI0010532123|nr:hypothetical protein [Actinomadura sp. GC306]TDC65215.1 hypothetical protein E1200_18825 [Actinomadura sp. GC306]
MSGYGGSPPPGWQDPYGGSQGWSGDPKSGDPYGTDPYGGGAYGGSAYGGGYPNAGYGPPGVPTSQSGNGSTVAALVCNIVMVVLCCGVLSIPGVITSAIAMGRVHSDPESARRLTVWSWVLFGASIVLGIIGLIIYVFVVVLAETNGYDSY